MNTINSLSGNSLCGYTRFPQGFSSNSDIIVMCAAVSDYKVEDIANEKIKSTKTSISLDLYPTTDIIKSLAKNTEATIVAFALETSNGKKNALKKLKDKGADVIVLSLIHI